MECFNPFYKSKSQQDPTSENILDAPDSPRCKDSLILAKSPIDAYKYRMSSTEYFPFFVVFISPIYRERQQSIRIFIRKAFLQQRLGQ